MNGEIGNVVRPAGNQKKSGVNSIEQLERNLSIGLAEKMGYNFHYNELIRVSEQRGIVYAKAKAVRNEDGKIDVVRTFKEVRTLRGSHGGM